MPYQTAPFQLALFPAAPHLTLMTANSQTDTNILFSSPPPVAVHVDYILRPGPQERALAHVPSGARTLPRTLFEMERVRPGGLCRTAAVADVPLPARTHRCLPEAHASAGLYIITAK